MNNCKSIIQEYLRNNGFDGLICDESPCGCGVDEIMDCGCCGDECYPAYATKCQKCGTIWYTRKKGKIVERCEECENVLSATKPESEVGSD